MNKMSENVATTEEKMNTIAENEKNKRSQNVSDYVAKFDAERFLEEISFSESAPAKELFRILGSLHHEVFSTLQSGESLLDVGSGPGIRNVVSASGKFQNITLSDPVPQNRAMVQQYIDDVTEDRKWGEYFRLAAELEGDVTRWPEVGARVRGCVKQVVWCDILSEAPLGEMAERARYDCVLTTLCLCCASRDLDTLASAIQNLVSLAKPGGDVIITEALDTGYYVIGGETFSHLAVTEAELCERVRAAGCEIVSFKKQARVTATKTFTATSVCVLHAKAPFP